MGASAIWQEGLIVGQAADPRDASVYRTADAQMGLGLLARWSRIERYYTLSVGVEVTALVMGHAAEVEQWGRRSGGRYQTWTFGPRLGVTVPFNRAGWIRRERTLVPIFSPRT